jgi:MFS family permease
MTDTASTAANPASGREVLRHGDFRLYLGARFATGLAVQVHDVGVGWYVYDITRSAWALGLVGLAVFLPNLLLVLVAGEVADRFDRRLVVTAAFATMALAAFGLLVTVIVGTTTALPVYGLAALLGTARAFAMPASQALVPTLVPRELFPRAIAWVSSTWQMSTIGGPALGGILYAFGAEVAFASAFAAFVAGAVAVFTIRPRPVTASGGRPSLERLFAGIAFIRSKPAILGAISLDLFAVLLGGATALLPIYARDILMTGPWGLGLLRSAPAVGAAIVGLWLVRHPLERHVGRRMFVAVAGFGLATIGFALSASLWLSLAFLFALGAADMVSMVIRQTLVQHETPDEMRGRVSAVNSVFIGASNELGQFESGAVAAMIGPVGSAVLGGIGTLVVAAMWMRLFPDLAKRDRLIEDSGAR